MFKVKVLSLFSVRFTVMKEDRTESTLKSDKDIHNPACFWCQKAVLNNTAMFYSFILEAKHSNVQCPISNVLHPTPTCDSG